ncbi:MAG: radical SAM protein [Candidatus Bathyarchaeia archaeon]
MREIKETKSLCPECVKVIPAIIYEEDSKVYLKKSCPEHGEFTDLYWGNYEQYMRVLKYDNTGVKLDNPRTSRERGCPYDCGICPEHSSHTVLSIIDVTNRCNLRCPICFAHAGAAGYIYEPTREQIVEMLKNLRANIPVPPTALQFSGGEPTVREDLPELVRAAKELGFHHVEVNSNGLKMAESVEYCRELKSAGVSTIYLQFDGVTPKPYLIARGFNLLPIKIRALENLKKAGFRSVVLVPVLVKGVNDDQVGDIVRFAVEHQDIIRGVNFQPVSITGRINRAERERMRITIPELMKLMEEQTDGLIKQEDWYPVPTVVPFSRFVGALKDKRYLDFSCHPHCGMATYLVAEEGKVAPITRYLNVDRFLKAIERANRLAVEGHKMRAKMSIGAAALRNIDLGMLRNYLLPVIWKGTYESLSELHHRMILVGAMHFMDPYNFDLERVNRCIIHYATPDGRIIPFCSMNTLHRSSVEKKFAQPLDNSKVTPLYDVESLRKRIAEEV